MKNQILEITFCDDFTVSFRDSIGIVKYAFELNPSDEHAEVIIWSDPYDTNRKRIKIDDSNRHRMECALSKVKAHLEGIGYKVVLQ